MAYLDPELSLPRSAFDLAEKTFMPRHVPASPLSTLETQVVQLARNDGRGSLSAAGLFQNVLAKLFGLKRPNPLADPRLEALRRYAVMLRLEGAVRRHDGANQLALTGFSTAAMSEVRRLVLDPQSAAA